MATGIWTLTEAERITTLGRRGLLPSAGVTEEKFIYLCTGVYIYIIFFILCLALYLPHKIETDYWSCVFNLSPFSSHRLVEASQLCTQSMLSCRGSQACGGGIVSVWSRVLCALWIILISKTILWSSLLYYTYFFAFMLKITTKGIASLPYIFSCPTFVPQSIKANLLSSIHLVL